MIPIKHLLGFFLVAMAVSGAALLHHASGMPEYTDEQRASHVRNWNPYAEPHHDLGELSRKWHVEMDSIRTSKWKYHDLGRGLLVLSVTAAGLTFYIRRFRGENWRTLTTPKRPLGFILVGNAILLFLYLDFVQQLFEDLERGMFPHWADSIAIPLMGAPPTFLTLSLVLSLTGDLVIRWRPLPLPLWTWDANSPVRMWILLAGCALMAVIPGLLLVSDVLNGTYFGPLGMITALYLLLSARAAWAAPLRRLSKAG